MKQRLALKAVLMSLLAIVLISPSFTQNAGFYVQGRKIFDANGNEFLIRGINHAHAWYSNQLATAIPAIAATKANCVRIVLSNGKRWTKNSPSEVQNIIDICKQNKLAIILEVHDCSGYSEQSGSGPLSTAVDYWIELKSILTGQEKFVIINIANEPFGNNMTADDWVDGHKNAIRTLRREGFKHLLLVDAANWGQDWQNITKTRAQDVSDADADKNTVFSIHMYDVYSSDSKVNAYLLAFVGNGWPLVVGEFAANQGSGKPVAAQAILDRCAEYGIGYLGWSWKGNSPGLESLDIAQNWNGDPLTAWGNLLINGANGIKSASITASVFTDLPIIKIYPPLHFAGRKIANRSLLSVEYINELTWEANPDNTDIRKYRIYLVSGGGEQLLGETGSAVLLYRQRKVEKDKEYRYAVSAVNGGGRESERAVVSVK